MDASRIIFISIGAVLLLILGGFFLYRHLYNIYINKRLRGETEKRKFFNYKAFAIIMTFNVCVFFITFLGMSLIQAKTEIDHYRGRIEELSPRQQLISDDTVIAEFGWLTNGMQGLDLSGYIVTKTTNGDFECYAARAKDAVVNNSLFPSYVFYFKYIGGELVNPSIEFVYTYSWGQNGYSVTYNEQYLLLTRLYHDEEIFSTIDIKISVDPQGNKTPQAHSQSHFDLEHK